MDYFDLHCDTATEIYKHKCGLTGGNFNVTLEKTEKYKRWAQVFAVWIDDSIRGNKAWQYFCSVSDYLKKELSRQKSKAVFCVSAKDLQNAAANKKRAAVLSIEGGAALAGNIDNIGRAYEKGVRLITLTWNGRCETGCGCMDKKGGGLTKFGRETVRQMEHYKMIVDVSHLSEEGFWDVAKIAKKPFAATHSDSKAVCPSKRNLTDAQFNEIVKGGGIVGINMHSGFLNEGTAGIKDVLKHTEHFLSLGGEKSLAIGADFDGCELPPDIEGADSMDKVYMAMRSSFGKKISDDIFYNNAYNFFIRNL